MWPFSKKEKSKEVVYMFNMEEIAKLESLSPEQIVTLVCMAAGLTSERAVMWCCPESIKPLVREVVR